MRQGDTYRPLALRRRLDQHPTLCLASQDGGEPISLRPNPTLHHHLTVFSENANLTFSFVQPDGQTLLVHRTTLEIEFLDPGIEAFSFTFG